MTKVIAVINQKGGVGKTATTCNLAYCFAQKKARTLLVDLDPSANASRIYLQDDPDLTIRDFLTSREFNVKPIISAHQGRIRVPDLFIIPSHISLALAEREIGNKPFRESILAKKLNCSYIKGIFDYILLDCPPTLTTLTINAMFAADMILIPVTYAKDALEGVADLFDLLSEIKDGHDYDIRILRNQFDARKKTANAYVAENLQPLVERDIVLKTIIRQDEEVNKASILGLTVMHYFPGSHATQDYNSLCTEIGEIK